ncbi:hypothetical protein GCM10011575_29990 [Microlunatus endophyticus]|uniref:Uncharacterized protein n=1 Tax=Microlunatus endophyticus TaxID=1716077 RepID=A0A917SB54_9ACTN|nr:hypothetical protein [Microlunatus endophyticus]GGL69381.1 hypothetical protein GCM10011575_29990 [Microlunatus endophyticus]
MHSIEEQFEKQLDQALESNGLTPLPEDRAALLKAFTTGREQAALVFSVAEARYEEPDLIFSASLS